MGEGADEAVGDDVENKVGGAGVAALRGILRHGLGVERCGIDVHAAARLKHGGHGQTDQQSECRHHFEVEERLDADAAKLAGVTHARDADDDAEEDDGSDQHPHELDEAVAEGLELLCEMRIEDAYQHAGDDAYEYAEIEGAKECKTSS
jgi:hypothetical protein